jgi:hypothetical protein
MSLTACPKCGKAASTDQVNCLSCGQRLQPTIATRAALLALMVLGALIGLAILGLVLGHIHQNDPSAR